MPFAHLKLNVQTTLELQGAGPQSCLLATEMIVPSCVSSECWRGQQETDLPG